MKDNKNTGFVFSIDKIAQFCKANFRYVSAGVMIAALVLVLSVSACNDKNNDDISGKEDNQQEERQDPEGALCARSLRIYSTFILPFNTGRP